jgi:hypothetical protein
MSNSYIPRRDSNALAWMRSFADGIAAQPTVYGLTTSDALSISNAVGAFEAAMRLAKNDGTRTPVTVLMKDEARAAAEQICQRYYSLIKPNETVSDADKVAIGVRPVNRGRTPITCPQTSPLLSITRCTPGVQVVRYADTNTPDSMAKPFGAVFLELRVAIADTLAGDVEQARPAGMFTRNPASVSFTNQHDRMKATYFARWVSRRGEVGPWSLPASMSIVA